MAVNCRAEVVPMQAIASAGPRETVMNTSGQPTPPSDLIDAEPSAADQADCQSALDTSNATPSASPDLSTDTATRHSEMLAAIRHLQGIIETVGERSRADQDIISRMQARIEALQADQVRALLGPVVTELAGLHADFAEAALRDYEVLGLARVKKEFGLLSSRIENALDLLGAVSVDAKPGQVFDSRLHTAARQTPTADAALDKTIAMVLRQGFAFQHEAKPALYARVNVYRYDSAPDGPAPQAELKPFASPAPVAAEPAAAPVDDAPKAADATPFQIPFESDKE